MKNKIIGDGDYGFIQLKDLPKDPCILKTIGNVDDINWLTTSETAQIAHNHCGATAVTNLMLYHHGKNSENLPNSSNRLDLFKEVHRDVGNGPVAMIAGSARKIFDVVGVELKYKSIGTYSDLKEAIEDDEIVGLLLVNGLFNWHWVLCIGYIEYEDGTIYLQIIDNWHNTTDRFYKIHSNSLWFSGTSYKI